MYIFVNRLVSNSGNSVNFALDVCIGIINRLNLTTFTDDNRMAYLLRIE